jgi:hypothetical protein
MFDARYRQSFVDDDSLSALTPNRPFIVFDPMALQKLDVFLLKRFSLPPINHRPIIDDDLVKSRKPEKMSC